MKKFLSHVLLFLLIFTLINLLIYRLILFEKVYKDYNISINELRPNDTIIFSDSHGYRLTLKNAKGDSLLRENGIYNFSFAGDSYFDMLNKLSFLLDQEYVPKVVILSVDRHMLSKKREQGHNLNRSIIYSNRTDFLEMHEESSVAYYFKRNIAKYLPLFDVNNSELLYNYAKSKLNRRVKVKAQWQNFSHAQQIKLSESKMLDHFPDEEKSKRLLLALERILLLCKQNNISVIGMKFPLADTYLDLLKNKNYNADSVLLRYDFPIMNYEDFFSGRDDLFADQDHINVTGANLLINQLLVDVTNE